MPKFNKPTNEWLEEEIEIPVMKPKLNNQEGRIEFTQQKQKATRKTYYADSKPRMVICASGQHTFRPLNIHKSLFKCTKCDYHKIAYPVTYIFDRETKQLINKISGVPV